MTWTLTTPLTGEHRRRFHDEGVSLNVLDEPWRLVTEPLPDWWHANGNALYALNGAMIPDAVLDVMMMIPVSGALVAIGSPMEHLSSLLIGGDGVTIFLDRRCVLTAGEIYCGADSTIVLHGPIVGTRQPILDARNGGRIVAAPDQLWAANVYIATDDMHRLADAHTDRRLNPFGAHITIGEHVWLCREAVVTGNSVIGDGACVAMRAMVRNQEVSPATAVAGVPARAIRRDIVWSLDDRP